MFDAILKALPGRRPSDAPVQPEILYLQNGIGVAIVQWNEHIQADAAMRHPVVHPALDKLASSFKQVEWQAEIDPLAAREDRTGKSQIIAAINNFLHCPNDEMTPSMLRYWMALNWACYGRIPYKVGFEALRQTVPNGLWPLEAKYVYAKRNNRGVVTEYRYGFKTEERSYRSRAVAEPGQSFVDQIWKPGLRGYQHRDETNAPLSAIGLPSQVIKSLLVRAINTAEGHPNVRYIVTADGTLTVEKQNAVKEILNNHHAKHGSNAGNIPILSNVPGFKIHTLDNDLSDIHSKMPADDMKRLIYSAFGIPIALAGVGAADAAKFAGNFDESRATFWEDTVDPGYVQPIFQGMSQSFCPPGVRIAPVYDAVPAMQQRRAMKMKTINEIEFLTTDEKRAMFGLDKEPALPVMTGGRGQRSTTEASNGTGNGTPPQDGS